MTETAEVYVNKIAAAQRQLDAAIRMTFAGEDDLAIHTVAAAAYSILRDIKKKNGKNELKDQIGDGLFAIAKDLVDGTLSEIPAPIANVRVMKELVLEISKHIKSSGAQSKEEVFEVHFPVSFEKEFWNKQNKPANFLKHADRDTDFHMSVEEFESGELIFMACGSFVDIMRVSTPEMIAFHVFETARTKNFDGMRERFKKISKKLSQLDDDSIRIKCQDLLKELKSDLGD